MIKKANFLRMNVSSYKGLFEEREGEAATYSSAMPYLALEVVVPESPAENGKQVPTLGL